MSDKNENVVTTVSSHSTLKNSVPDYLATDFLELTAEEILERIGENEEVGRSAKEPVIVDISHWQAPNLIDYDKLAGAIDLAIIRIQHGNEVDRQYQVHLNELQKRQVPVHVYAYFMGTSAQNAQQEAQDLFDRASKYKPYFYWVDVETKSAANMREAVSAFTAHLRKLVAGEARIGAYIANHLYRDFNLKVEEFDAIWIPTYGSNDGQYRGSNPGYPCDLHQYTDKGRLPGYNLDLDLSRLTLTNGRNLNYFITPAKETKPSTSLNVSTPAATPPQTAPAAAAPKPQTPAPAAAATAAYYPAPAYKGTSFVDALAAAGGDSSMASRTKIAAANGIPSYTGTPAQNTALLGLLLAGKLKKSGAAPAAASSSGSVQAVPAPAPASGSVRYFAIPNYKGASLVDALNLLKVDSSLANRKKIAAANGIPNYNGTVTQNTQLLKSLLAGKLINPATPPAAQPAASTAYYPAPAYRGASFVDALAAIKVDASLANRQKIAKANGLASYNGTAAQNSQLLNLLLAGKLKKY